MTIFENDFIKVSTTGHDYDFIAVIENKTNNKICVHYDEPGYNDNYDPILIRSNKWVGLLANNEGRDWVRAIENNQVYVTYVEADYYTTGCSIMQWNEDCEEITAEVERILNEYRLYNHDRNTNVANSNQLVTVIEILKNIK